jgi:hypothetical protein
VIKIRNLLIGLCLTVFLLATLSSARAQIGELPELPENMNIDVTLDLESDGSFHLTVTVEATGPGGGFEYLPITSANVNIEISSPSSGQLEIDLNGSATLSEYGLGEMPPELTVMTPEMINLMLQPFEGEYLSDLLENLFDTLGEEVELPLEVENLLPSEVEDLRLDSVSCTEFSWDGPTLEVGLTTTLSGSIFEDEELRAELPVTIHLSFEGDESSMSLSISASSETVEFSMTFDITVTDDTWDVSLELEVIGELPQEGENVQWDFELSEAQQFIENMEGNLDDWLENNNIELTLKVPEDAGISGDLPSGSTQSDSTYTWRGDDAADALESIITGQVDAQIEYEYMPPEEPSEGLPWLWIGVGVAVVVVIVIAIVAARR